MTTIVSPSIPDKTIRLETAAAQSLIFGLAVQLALIVPSAAALFYDDRLINDISVWVKPLKFQLSLAVMMLTLLLLLPLLSPLQRSSRLVRWSALAASFAGLVEIFYIVIQSARGRASHFNNDTPLEQIMYGVMGIGAVVLVASSFLIGWAIWQNRNADDRIGLRLGGAVGLMLGAVLTLITASMLSSGALIEPGHWVNGIRSDANGLPLVGWSSTGGDLRVPHFFATHLMQALPILGLLSDRFTPAQGKTMVWGGAAFGTLVVIATFAQAMMGYPFI